MKFEINIKKCLILLCYCFSHGNFFAQEPSVFTQNKWPDIKVSNLSEQIFKKENSIGIVPFGNGIYTDSLTNYLDTIIQVKAPTEKERAINQAIYGKDTLTYKQIPLIWRTIIYDSKDKKRFLSIDVESKIPPYTRFVANIEGLNENEITVLKDSMLRMKSPKDTLMNASQTCVFYALEAIFNIHGIYTSPVITRNTTYNNPKELIPFFEHFLKRGDDYPCHYKKVKDLIFPNNSVLVIINGYGEIIHAFFHHNNEFYSKNGRFSLERHHNIHRILQGYGTKDYSGKMKLNKVGKMQKGQILRVYTFDTNKFKKDSAMIN